MEQTARGIRGLGWAAARTDFDVEKKNISGTVCHVLREKGKSPQIEQIVKEWGGKKVAPYLLTFP